MLPSTADHAILGGNIRLEGMSFQLPPSPRLRQYSIVTCTKLEGDGVAIKTKVSFHVSIKG